MAATITDLTQLKRALDMLQTGGEQNHQPLHSGGGGGTSDDMSLVDAKIAAAEARTDTKFAEVMGELKAIEHSTAGTKTTVIGTGIAVLAIVIAVFAWGGQMFSSGMDAQTIANKAVQSVDASTGDRLSAIEAHMQATDDRLQNILAAIQMTSSAQTGAPPANSAPSQP